MIYKVIGLMSGSSLDGLDIAYCQLEETRGQWVFEILHAECIPYSHEWAGKLQHAKDNAVSNFLKLNTAYGRYIGESINEFISRYELAHKVHFISSHGHTAFHEPHNNTTCQIGDGASIAAITGLPVISDLRAADVALGGQGAPIVPIGDKLLFGSYDYLLNIGGIANMTMQRNESWIAFDICPANQVLNTLASREGKSMDEDGRMAAQGSSIQHVLDELNDADYYQRPAPKSLSNEEATALAFPPLRESEHTTPDMLHTMVQHIAEQVAAAAKQYPHGKEQASMLVTGGGAFNKFLMLQLTKALQPLNIAVTIPDNTIVQYKEALVMALIGALRWREEVNVLSSVTGASRDSTGGALWIP